MTGSDKMTNFPEIIKLVVSQLNKHSHIINIYEEERIKMGQQSSTPSRDIEWCESIIRRNINERIVIREELDKLKLLESNQ